MPGAVIGKDYYYKTSFPAGDSSKTLRTPVRKGLVRLYEKGNLEIHSSDAGGYTDRNSNYTRRGKLHVGEIKKLRD